MTREHWFTADLCYGVVENLDVAISLGYSDMFDRNCEHDEEDVTHGPHSGDGISDIALGAKWRFFYNENARLDFAYLPGLTTPIGERTDGHHLGPSQEFWAFDQKLVMSKDWER